MILVTGATGNVGGELVRALLDAGERVRALVRESDSLGFPDGVQTVVGDLNEPETLGPALAGVGRLFLLPGYRDMRGLLAAADRAAVERVVLLSSGAAADGDRSNAISRYMIDSESAVRDSGLAWTILRASGFMSNVLRDWLPQLLAGDVIRAPFADVPIAVIDPLDIAAVAATALRDQGHEGEIYRLTGPQALLPADQVAVLAAVLARDLRFEAQTDAEARADMSASMPSEYVDAFFSYFADGTYDDSRVLPTVKQLTGRPPRTFEQWATAHGEALGRRNAARDAAVRDSGPTS
jgi:uncharacterized protein YbjT (DUF2867 family)